MIFEKLFGFPVEEGLFDKVITILKQEYGLVDGKSESPRVLVWEDEKGVGRYRVHCFNNEAWEIPKDGKRWDYFDFHYWLSPSRFDKEVLLRDPMKEPLQRILSLSNNKHETDHRFFESSIEELERGI